MRNHIKVSQHKVQNHWFRVWSLGTECMGPVPALIYVIWAALALGASVSRLSTREGTDLAWLAVVWMEWVNVHKVIKVSIIMQQGWHSQHVLSQPLSSTECLTLSQPSIPVRPRHRRLHIEVAQSISVQKIQTVLKASLILWIENRPRPSHVVSANAGP